MLRSYQQIWKLSDTFPGMSAADLHIAGTSRKIRDSTA
jgi:hypothetical protein